MIKQIHKFISPFAVGENEAREEREAPAGKTDEVKTSETDSTKNNESKFPVVHLVRSKRSHSGRGSRGSSELLGTY